ncbi:hypothetical protein J2T19_005054 [Paenibacillus tundrae]|uniref:AraC family transcriptional regulator n=1 Tax=Paenibacillus tundrae TaxID=528187 RepID=A0ABT9WJY0_9BACL|nr:hypothetical protein [Paenibacillus tundrae]
MSTKGIFLWQKKDKIYTEYEGLEGDVYTFYETWEFKHANSENRSFIFHCVK